MTNRIALLLVVALCAVSPSFAQAPPPPSSAPEAPAMPEGKTPLSAEEFEAKLGYQTGTVTLEGGIATLRLPESFRFIGPEGSRRLLTEAWGNPPQAAQGVLGMLIPKEASPLGEDGWGVVITFDDSGYVDDKDAATMDYDKLLKDLQEGIRSENEQRKKAGFQAMTLVGWAEPPHYDAAAHKLYWAKDLTFDGSDHHTLNYNIRILGRRGVLVLNAVAAMAQIDAVRGESGAILAAVEFNEGHRYADYLPGKDKAAAYGVAGLILGATAAKAGLFKMLWVGILAFKKLIIAGLVALFPALKKVFSRKEAAGTASTTTATTTAPEA
ncbi:MAG TPA: DUF2167 domain-containing protein [Candidatus Polarisedimenticolia bacterium]|nr:DUF2167 domain-containing protein [Candidatus Polarisedimenticolia bacterium]